MRVIVPISCAWDIESLLRYKKLGREKQVPFFVFFGCVAYSFSFHLQVTACPLEYPDTQSHSMATYPSRVVAHVRTDMRHLAFDTCVKSSRVNQSAYWTNRHRFQYSIIMQPHYIII